MLVHVCIRRYWGPLEVAMAPLTIRMHLTLARPVHIPPCRWFDFRLSQYAASMHFNAAYRPLTHPMPSYTHSNYPMYTPGGGDQRWHPNVMLEEGVQWVGGLMYANLTVICY